MFLWIRNFFLKNVYEDVVRRKLLEKVDIDSLSYEIHKIDNPSPFYLISMIIGGTSVVSLAVYKGNFYLASLMTTSTLCICGVSYFVSNSICQIPKILSALRDVMYSLRRTIKIREQVTFGLGLTASTSQNYYMRNAFNELRRFINVLNISVSKLVNELEGESEHMLSNYYTEEIIHLLQGNESYISQSLIRNINVLVDIAILHISELCRLYIINIKSKDLSWLYIFSNELNKSLISLYQELTYLSTLPLTQTKELLSTDPAILAGSTIKPEEAVALALDSVSSSILSNSMSADDCRKALQKILDMSWLCIKVEDKNSCKQVECTTDRNTIENIPVIAEKKVICDEVFEAFSEYKDPHAMNYLEDINVEKTITNATLMNEIRMALNSRSKEFEYRERKALAKFYGISEEELEQRAKEKHNEVDSSKIIEEKEENLLERQPICGIPLSSDLLRALKERRSINETVFIDSVENTLE